ncbi:MAG: zinc ribbon domain-containing protein [Pelosinus sp.]|nr:zinc ribbon domain-containing protein [Pelosinus sp.]
MILKCKKCSHALNEKAKFCPECGTPVPRPEPPHNRKRNIHLS